MKVLVFDTETTGLPEGRNPSIYQTDKWPYILQLSYIIYDTDIQAILRYIDCIIRIPDDVTISDGSIEIHGITREASNTQGIPIEEALADFDYWVKQCDLIVGHNISFDKRMLIVEHIRNRMRSGLGSEVRLPEYCTMKRGAPICNIVVSPQDKKSYVKYPKLSELYMKLFSEEAQGVHNAFADVLLCLRCYCAMAHDADIKKDCSGIRQLFRYYCKS